MNSTTKVTSNEKKPVTKTSSKNNSGKNSKKRSKKNSKKNKKPHSKTSSQSRKPSRIKKAVMKVINCFKKQPEPEEDFTKYYLERELQPPLKLERGASCIHHYSELQPVSSLKQFSRTEKWELQILPSDAEDEMKSKLHHSKGNFKVVVHHPSSTLVSDDKLKLKFANSDYDFSKLQPTEKEIFRMIFLCTDVTKVDSHKRLIRSNEDEIETQSAFWQFHWSNMTNEIPQEKLEEEEVVVEMGLYDKVDEHEQEKEIELHDEIDEHEQERVVQRQQEEFNDMWSVEEDNHPASEKKHFDVQEQGHLKTVEIQQTEELMKTTTAGTEKYEAYQLPKEVESMVTIDCLSNLTTPYTKVESKEDSTIPELSPSKSQYEEFDSFDSLVSSFYSLDSSCLKRHQRTPASTYTRESKRKSPAKHELKSRPLAKSEPKNESLAKSGPNGKSPRKHIDYNALRKPSKHSIKKLPEQKSSIFDPPPPDMRYKKRKEGEVYIPAYFRLHSSIDFERALKDPLPSAGDILKPFKCGNRYR